MIISLYRTMQSFIRLHTLNDGFVTSRSGEGFGYESSYVPSVNGTYFTDERRIAQNRIALVCEFSDRGGYAEAVKYADGDGTMLEYDTGTEKYYRKVRFLSAQPKVMKLGRIRATLTFDALTPYFQAVERYVYDVTDPQVSFDVHPDLPMRLYAFVQPFDDVQSVTIAATGAGGSIPIGSITVSGPFEVADQIEYSSEPTDCRLLINGESAAGRLDMSRDNFFDISNTAGLTVSVTSGAVCNVHLILYTYFKEIS